MLPCWALLGCTTSIILPLPDFLGPEIRQFPSLQPVRRDVVALHEPSATGDGNPAVLAVSPNNLLNRSADFRIGVVQRFTSMTILHHGSTSIRKCCTLLGRPSGALAITAHQESASAPETALWGSVQSAPVRSSPIRKAARERWGAVGFPDGVKNRYRHILPRRAGVLPFQCRNWERFSGRLARFPPV